MKKKAKITLGIILALLVVIAIGTAVYLSDYYRADDAAAEAMRETTAVQVPQDFTERIIEGGCHAYFGSYGAQDGDGAPTISRSEQLGQTARYIADFVIG